MLHWKKINSKKQKKKKKASHIFSFNVLGSTYTAVVPFLMFFILASTFFPTNLTHYCFKIQFIPCITKKKPWSECSFFLSNLGLLTRKLSSEILESYTACLLKVADKSNPTSILQHICLSCGWKQSVSVHSAIYWPPWLITY